MQSATPIRLYILDDHALFRDALARLLDADETLSVVGASGSTKDARRELKALAPDILILDYDLGDQNTLEFVETIRQDDYSGSILLVTAGLPDQHALEFIRLGVAGVFHKQKPPEDLHATIRELADGRVVLDQAYLQSLAAAAVKPRPNFTSRDKEVLRFLVEGRANKEIAAELGVSESAIKGNLQQLFAKAGVRTRSQLVRMALEDYRDWL